LLNLVPVYHNYPLAPLLEIAEAAVNSLASSVIGFYFANESVADEQLPVYITKIEKTIIAKHGACIIVQISNRLIDDLDANCFMVSLNYTGVF
jgi:Uncharacterised protein family (UPF0172)